MPIVVKDSEQSVRHFSALICQVYNQRLHAKNEVTVSIGMVVQIKCAHILYYIVYMHKNQELDALCYDNHSFKDVRDLLFCVKCIYIASYPCRSHAPSFSTLHTENGKAWSIW